MIPNNICHIYMMGFFSFHVRMMMMMMMMMEIVAPLLGPHPIFIWHASSDV